MKTYGKLNRRIRLADLKWLLLLLTFFLIGCSSYERSSQGLSCQMDYQYAGRDELVVSCKVSNHASKPVTLVEHPDFALFWVDARSEHLVEDRAKMVVHYEPASLADLRRIPPGGSFTFRESFGYRRISPQVVEVYHGPISKGSRYFRIRDSKLKAKFSYGFYAHSFPWQGRFLQPGILLVRLEAHKTIDAK